MEEGLLLHHILFQGVCCCQPGNCVKWLHTLSSLEQALQNLVTCFSLATVLGQKGSAKQPCRKQWLVEKTVFIPTVPSALPSQISLGWVWGRCFWQACFSPGGTAPTWSSEMGRRATTQTAGQVMVAGPFTWATYPVVFPCPQQLLKEGNVIQSRDGKWTIPQEHNWAFLFLFRCWSVSSNTTSFPKKPGGFTRRVEQYMSSVSPLNMKVRWCLTQQGFSQQKDEWKKPEEKPSKAVQERGSGVKGDALVILCPWSLPCATKSVWESKTRGFCKQLNQVQKKIMSPIWHQPKHLVQTEPEFCYC